MSAEKKAVALLAVCVAVIAFGLFYLRGREAPSVVTHERLANLQAAIEAWAAEHGGPPESLEAMGLADEAIRDHSGTVFHYHVTEDGRIRLISYGVDGKPGGYMFRADTEVSFQVTPSPDR